MRIIESDSMLIHCKIEGCMKLLVYVGCLVVAAIIVVLVLTSVDDRDPYFKVESIVILLEDDNYDHVTARWDIRVSVENVNAVSYLHFQDFNVWVRCMSESSSQAVIPPFKLGHGDAILMNATVKTVLSAHARSQLIHGTVIDLNFKAKYKNRYGYYYRRDVVCKDVGVGFLSDATRGGVVSNDITCSKKGVPRVKY